MAIHWHPTGKWQGDDHVLTELIEKGELKESKIDDYLSSLEDQSEDDFFQFDSIHVEHSYNVSDSPSFKEKKWYKTRFNKMTLYRAKNDQFVTYSNILECARIVCPTDYSGIEKFEYVGFSDDGIPTLKVTMNW